MRSQLSKRAPALALFVLLQACGGGGGDEPTNNGSPTAAAPAAPTSPAPAASNPASDITCGLANFEADALRLVNQYRAAGATCGAKTFAPAAGLALSDRLTSAAYGHSRDMADKNYFDHQSLDGRTMGERVAAAGYAGGMLGENIAAGYDSVDAVVKGWMTSPGHCENLMNPDFTDFGLACARNDASQYRIYWTQDLGRP
jgi:uncharacterized protein YkwD